MIMARATVDEGTDSDGVISLGFSGPGTTAYEVGSFDCGFVRFPDRPYPPANDAQLRYLYDYLTTFMAPCDEAHGAHVEAAPSRSEFLAQWASTTGTRREPLPPNAADAPDPVYNGKNAVCPGSVPGL